MTKNTCFTSAPVQVETTASILPITGKHSLFGASSVSAQSFVGFTTSIPRLRVACGFPMFRIEILVTLGATLAGNHCVRLPSCRLTSNSQIPCQVWRRYKPCPFLIVTILSVIQRSFLANRADQGSPFSSLSHGLNTPFGAGDACRDR